MEATKTDWTESSDYELAQWKRIRLAIEHENNLINMRTTWLLTSHAFLFYILGNTATEYIKSSLHSNFYLAIISAVTACGFLVCNIIRNQIRLALDQHDHLRDWWHGKFGQDSQRHPNICGYTEKKKIRNISHLSLSTVFLLIWSLLSATITIHVILR